MSGYHVKIFALQDSGTAVRGHPDNYISTDREDDRLADYLEHEEGEGCELVQMETCGPNNSYLRVIHKYEPAP